MSETEAYKNKPNEEAYKAMDAANAARDALIIAIEQISHVHKYLHAMGQSEDWRRHNLTNTHLVGLHEAFAEVGELCSQAHIGILKGVAQGRGELGKAFVFSHASEPRVGYDGGCDC